MIVITSDVTGKTYDTIEAAETAERLEIERRKEAERAERVHQEAIDKAFNDATTAINHYFELIASNPDGTKKKGNYRRYPINEDIYNFLFKCF